jgi:hypothetical protein
MLTVLDDITGQTISANAVELDRVLHKYDYRQLAHRFADQLRREEQQRIENNQRARETILKFPDRQGLERAS